MISGLFQTVWLNMHVEEGFQEALHLKQLELLFLMPFKISNWQRKSYKCGFDSLLTATQCLIFVILFQILSYELSKASDFSHNVHYIHDTPLSNCGMDNVQTKQWCLVPGYNHFKSTKKIWIIFWDKSNTVI